MWRKVSIAFIALVLVTGGGLWLWAERAEANAPKVGDRAPAFTAQGALNGEAFTLSLEDKLKSGPLVLYFFPKVFTEGCTLETREFSRLTPQFNALGADIVGMSADDPEGIKRFSKAECRDNFALASASPEIVDAYGVSMAPGMAMTGRTSFVIDRDGVIHMIHSDLDYKDHALLALQAVRTLNGQ